MLSLVVDRRVQLQLRHAEFLPRAAGSRTRCVFACRGDAAGKYLPPRAEEEPGVQSLWGLCTYGLLRGYFLFRAEWTVLALGLVFLDWIDFTVSS